MERRAYGSCHRPGYAIAIKPLDYHYALVGCTVAPGFDFADFEMGNGDELLRRYPMHADIIRRLTRIFSPTL